MASQTSALASGLKSGEAACVSGRMWSSMSVLVKSVDVSVVTLVTKMHTMASSSDHL